MPMTEQARRGVQQIRERIETLHARGSITWTPVTVNEPTVDGQGFIRRTARQVPPRPAFAWQISSLVLTAFGLRGRSEI